MDVNGWEYYNHAVIPTTAPHEVPDLLPIQDKSVWNIQGKFPLFARWTTDFDCGHETDWWYIIKEAPFDLEALPSKERKSIRQALGKSCTRVICMSDHVDELYRVFLSAHKKYQKAGPPTSFEGFQRYCKRCDEHYQCWAGFDRECHTIIGYMIVEDRGDFVEILSAKFDPEYSRLRVSDTLNYSVLDFYLNQKQRPYVSSGERTVNHVTGTQEYKIRRFGYRKAYCQLHMVYNPKIKWLIPFLYLFRKILIKFDGNTKIHLVNSVLKMQEIACKRRGG